MYIHRYIPEKVRVKKSHLFRLAMRCELEEMGCGENPA